MTTAPSAAEQAEARLCFLRLLERAPIFAECRQLVADESSARAARAAVRRRLADRGLGADWIVDATCRALRPRVGLIVDTAREAVRTARAVAADESHLLTEGERTELAESAEQWGGVRRSAQLKARFDRGDFVDEPDADDFAEFLRWHEEYQRHVAMLPLSANPALERREEFLARAAEHYDRRAAAFRARLGMRPRRAASNNLSRDTEWTFAHYVDGRSFRQIARAAGAEFPRRDALDARVATVKQAVRRCATLLALREPSDR